MTVVLIDQNSVIGRFCEDDIKVTVSVKIFEACIALGVARDRLDCNLGAKGAITVSRYDQEIAPTSDNVNVTVTCNVAKSYEVNTPRSGYPRTRSEITIPNTN